MADIEKQSEDILRIEGVKAKGYGIIPNAVMIDRDLSVSAKAIYAYFCSLSGRGETVFPGREKILADLRISKEAYYKGQKELVSNGYITITQERSRSEDGKFKFQHNVYTITACPSKYLVAPSDPALTEMYKEIATYGLHSQGYGIIPYAVTSDSRMKYQPKATYGYLASYIGADKYADLDAGKIAFHLGISKADTVQGYIKQLVKLNYITVTRLYENGRFISKNRYTLADAPTVHDARTVEITPPNVVWLDFATDDTKLLDVQKQDTELAELLNVQKQDTEPVEILNPEKQDTEPAEILNPEKQDTEPVELLNPEKQDTEPAELLNPEKQDPEKQDPEKQDTTITSITITSIYQYDDDSSRARAKKQIGYDRLQKMYSDIPEAQQLLDTLVKAIAEVYAAPGKHRIIIARESVTCDFARIKLEMVGPSHVVAVMERILARYDTIDPKHYKSYLLTAIYQEAGNIVD